MLCCATVTPVTVLIISSHNGNAAKFLTAPSLGLCLRVVLFRNRFCSITVDRGASPSVGVNLGLVKSSVQKIHPQIQYHDAAMQERDTRFGSSSQRMV